MLKNVLRFSQRFLPYLGQQLKEQECQKQAAALTYMTLFALVPMITVTYALFSVLPTFQQAGNVVQDFLFGHFLPESGQELKSYLADFSAQARNLTGPGVLLLVLTAFSMLRSIEKTFNRIWGVDRGRRGLHGFLLYWAILSLGPLLLGLGIIMGTYLMSMRLLSDTFVEGWVAGFLIFLPLLLNTGAFTLLFAAVPNCRVPLRNALVGGLVTAILFELLKTGFGAFVANTTFKAIYGAFALIPLFLLWVNLLWLIVLAGAILVKALATYRTSVLSKPYPDLVAGLLSLWNFHLQQASGRVTTDKDLLAAGVLPAQWRRLRRRFVSQRLVVVTAEGEYVLSRDLHGVTLAELANLLKVDEQIPVATDYLQRFHWFPEFSGRLQAIEHYRDSQFNINLGELFHRADLKAQQGTPNEAGDQGHDRPARHPGAHDSAGDQQTES